MQKIIYAVQFVTNIFLLLAVAYLSAQLQEVDSKVEGIRAAEIAAQSLFFRED